jgi:hypothetical protein
LEVSGRRRRSLRPMISDSITAQVCGAPTEAMETAAPWKPWKTQKAGFPPFPPRLENSPQKTRSEFSTVPTASAANILSLKRETVSSRRCSCSRTWFAIAISPVHRKQAGRPAISLTRRSRESLCLTSPFIERGPRHCNRRVLSIGHRYAVSRTFHTGSSVRFDLRTTPTLPPRPHS